MKVRMIASAVQRVSISGGSLCKRLDLVPTLILGTNKEKYRATAVTFSEENCTRLVHFQPTHCRITELVAKCPCAKIILERLFYILI